MVKATKEKGKCEGIRFSLVDIPNFLLYNTYDILFKKQGRLYDEKVGFGFSAFALYGVALRLYGYPCNPHDGHVGHERHFVYNHEHFDKHEHLNDKFVYNDDQALR